MTQDIDPNSFEARLDRFFARNIRVLAVVIGLLWIGYGSLRAATCISEVSKNGLGRFATQFGLSRGEGFNSVTNDDIYFFVAILIAAAMLVIGGLLAVFRFRVAVFIAMAGVGLFVLLALPPAITSKDPLVALLMFSMPLMLMFTGIVFHVGLRESKKLSGSNAEPAK